MFTQDYAPLAGSVDAAALHARTMAAEYQPHRVDDAETIVRLLIEDALSRTGPDDSISLVTTVTPGGIRFDVHDPNTPIEGVPPVPNVQSRVSARADFYGSDGVSAGSKRRHKVWVVLGAVQLVPA